MRLSICLILCLGLVSRVWSEEFGGPVTGEAKTAFLATWSERLRGMRALHMTFRQEKHLRVLRQALTSQGELWLKDEKLLYTLTNAAGETELTVHLDKQTVRTYYPLLHTLEVIEMQTAGAVSQPLPLWSAEPEVLNRDYEVELFRHATDVHTLRLVPRDANSPLQEMQLELRDFQPQTVVQVEKSGTRVRLHITSFDVNPEFSAAQLELRVPAETKIVYPLK